MDATCSSMPAAMASALPARPSRRYVGQPVARDPPPVQSEAVHARADGFVCQREFQHEGRLGRSQGFH
jgi:DNA-binding IclR family transcriptional regulator